VIGSLLSVAHDAFQAMTAPIRNRRQSATSAWSNGRQRFHSTNPADDRGRGEIAKANRTLCLDALRAEQRMGWRA